MIVSDLLDDALRIANVMPAPGQTPSPSKRAEALHVLNGILDAWKTSRREVYSTPRLAFPLTAGQQSYTIGPGGQINIPRPPKIDLASILLNGTELPLTVYQDAQLWQQVYLKSLGSTIPSVLYYDRASPTGNIFLWPIPYAGLSLVLYPWQQIAEFSAVTDAVSLPPAYRAALEYALGLELTIRYGHAPHPALEKKADSYKARLESLNAPSPQMTSDYGLLGNGYGRGGAFAPIVFGGSTSGGGGVATQWIASNETPDGIRTTFSFSAQPQQVAYNGLMQFLGQGFVYNGSNQVQIILRDALGNTITPGVGDSIMGQII